MLPTGAHDRRGELEVRSGTLMTRKVSKGYLLVPYCRGKKGLISVP